MSQSFTLVLLDKVTRGLTGGWRVMFGGEFE
jgi:hypothetical protein